ncbi:MAG: hypothetical protein M5R36_19945 [Deltaproteobacteria bacterium]|nr:hypothetical protein [Deltaproteobacteria bacterium]
MRGFLLQYKVLLAAIALTLLGLHVASLAITGNEDIGWAGRTVLTIYTPVHKVISWPFRKIAGLAGDYLLLVDVKEENRRLKQRVEELAPVENQLGELRAENERLRELLDLPLPKKSQTRFRKSHRAVERPGISHPHRRKRPRRRHREKHDRAIAVGSRRPCLRDHRQRRENYAAHRPFLGCRRGHSTHACVRSLRGQGKNKCVMEFIERTDDVLAGDTVVSSGIGGVFPKGTFSAR